MLWLILLAFLLVVAITVPVTAFNRLRRQDVRAQEALGGIDVQLTRRADLVPALVETVKGYAGHERALFDEVTAARGQVQRATASDATVAQRAQASDALDRSLLHVNAVAESYPALQASSSFLALQEQLTSTEDQLAFARQYYNDAVSTLNTTVATIPWMWFAPAARVRARSFYEALDDEKDPPQVSF